MKTYCTEKNKRCSECPLVISYDKESESGIDCKANGFNFFSDVSVREEFFSLVKRAVKTVNRLNEYADDIMENDSMEFITKISSTLQAIDSLHNAPLGMGDEGGKK